MSTYICLSFRNHFFGFVIVQPNLSGSCELFKAYHILLLCKLLFLNLRFHDYAGGVLELIVLNRDNLLLHITTNQFIFKYLMFELVGVSESFFSSFHSYWIITTLSAS